MSVLDTPRARQLYGLGRLAVDGLGVGIEGIRRFHLGVAERSFAATAPFSAPVRVAHDTIASAAYGAVDRAGRVLGLAAARAGILADSRQERPALTESAHGVAVMGALNGAFADHLDPELHVEMGFHPTEHPVHTPKLVVFVHGLCESDLSWRLGGRPAYGQLLADELGYTPLYLRYNTGLRIEENGRRLAALLDETIAEWPIEVEQLVLVGHSMGGLVIRAACHEGGDWCGVVRQAIYLGSPHLGAPLEQGAERLAQALARMPETRVLSDAIGLRSAGIKDLNAGYPDAPLLDCADHYCIGATITRSDRHPLGRALGDLLVLSPSAGGPGPRRRAEDPVRR